MRCQIVDVPHCGTLRVYVQGERKTGKIGFLTVHDVGRNHKAFEKFIECPYMRGVAEKSVWINVCLPGQDDDAETLAKSFSFPSLDQIVEDLLFLLDKHYVQSVFAFGDGAGANILYRFGLKYPKRCLGLILINFTNDVSKNKTASVNMRLMTTKESCGKFIFKIRSIAKRSGKEVALNATLNMHNVALYWQSFSQRTDISRLISSNNMVSVLMVAGKFSPHVRSTRKANDLNMNQQILVVLDAVDPLTETPEELVKALILFCKGCGAMIDVPMPGLEKEYKQVKDRRPPTELQMEVFKKYQRYEDLLQNEDF